MQPVLAGAVFSEWYWGPLFVLLFIGVPLVATALVFDGLFTFVVRRRGGGPRSAGAHVRTVATVTGAGALLIWGVFAYGEQRQRDQRVDRALAAIGFGLYEPSPLPAGYRPLWIRPEGDGATGPELVGAYHGPGGGLTVTQRAAVPGGAAQIAGRCFAAAKRPGEPVRYSPPGCSPRATPGGRPLSDDGREVATRLGDTRVTIGYDATVPRAHLEQFVDALKLTPERDLHVMPDYY